jgi:hypothetical protein
MNFLQCGCRKIVLFIFACFVFVARTQPTLSVARRLMGATSVGQYALFAGGVSSLTTSPFFSVSNRVDIWNSQNNTWSTSFLSSPRALLAATSHGNLAFFGGGYSTFPSTGVNNPLGLRCCRGGGPFGSVISTIEVWNTETWTWITPAPTLSVARGSLAAVSVGRYVLFSGGKTATTQTSAVTTVDIWENTTNTWNTTQMVSPRFSHVAIAFGKFAVMMGGGPAGSFVTEFWNSETLTWSFLNNSLIRQSWNGAGTVLAGAALFLGGMGGLADATKWLAYDIDSPNPPNLIDGWTYGNVSGAPFTAPSRRLFLVTAGNIAFYGGADGSGADNDWPLVISNTTLCRGKVTTSLASICEKSVDLSVARTDIAATVVLDKYIVLAGGVSNTSVHNTVDIIDIQSLPLTTGTTGTTQTASSTGTTGTTATSGTTGTTGITGAIATTTTGTSGTTAAAGTTGTGTGTTGGTVGTHSESECIFFFKNIIKCYSLLFGELNDFLE